MPIPEFRRDGYLPTGMHLAPEREVLIRLGEGSLRRQFLMRRVTEWISLLRGSGGHRLFLNGCFVTAKAEPGDVDAVCWLPANFEVLVDDNVGDAVRLYQMLMRRQPAELFGVFTRERWDGWVTFFRQTREPDGRLKGLVEVEL